MDKLFKYMILFVLAFTLTACSEPEDDGPVVPLRRAKIKKPVIKKEEVISEDEKRRLLLQNMRAGRNPFKSYITDDDVEDRGPLECCDITQFKVLLVLVGMEGGDKAKIQVPTGEKYTIQVGSRIGNRKGKVYKISSNTIFIKEKHKNVLGEEETVRVEIALPLK